FSDCFIETGAIKLNPDDPNEIPQKYVPLDKKWPKYPVIKLDFSKIGNDTPEILAVELQRLLYNVAKQYEKYSVVKDLESPVGHNSFRSYYENLIDSLKKLREKDSSYSNKVIVLIDEYDSPIAKLKSNIDKLYQAYKIKEDSKSKPQVIIDAEILYKKNKDILEGFLSVVKSCSGSCQLILLTGVYKFSLSELGSGANIFHPGNVSLLTQYAGVVGYTKEHIETIFKRYPFIKNRIEKCYKKTNNIDVMDRMQAYYNGYKFHANGEPMYNPSSVLSCFESGEIKGYWKDTADTTILTDQMEANIERFSVKNIKESLLQTESDLLSSKDLKQLDIIPLMYQTGYLTITSHDLETQKYTLDFPNQEVKQALYEHFEKHLTNQERTYGIAESVNVQSAFKQEDWQKLFSIFRSNCYAKASYELTEKSEKSFHALLYSFLNGVFLGDENVEISAETISNIGQTDIVIKDKSNHTIYILELKLNKDACTGLKQILDRDYYGQYINEYGKIVCIGLNIRFNDDNKNNPDPSHRNIDACALLIRRRDYNNNWKNDLIKQFAYSPISNRFSMSELSKEETEEIYKSKPRNSKQG
ncbi:AAA family ATPase, partial [Cardinium endosymbiont of Culicoides punctatus]|uniref:AAA family ATPase n=1 Tax=Cardinium endosymbiont of Culicoides punctatus TaxID=2304601 RepID=UPI0010588EDB